MKKKNQTSKRRTQNAVGSDALVRATLTRAVVGRWTRWEKGTAVLARKQDDGRFFLWREKPDGVLHCCNQMAGVPRDLLRFNPDRSRKGRNCHQESTCESGGRPGVGSSPSPNTETSQPRGQTHE